MKDLKSKYDILKVIGHGGYSSVFKARSKDSSEKIFALKQLDIAIEDENSKEYKDFKEEVKILQKLNHPNIVKVYNEYILDQKPSLEMEFLDGETLESVLKNESYFSIEETLQVIEQISSALNYCHHYQSPIGITASQYESALFKRDAIIHNDINPKNIIRTKNQDGSYRYVLIDFGLSFTDPVAVQHSKKEDGMAEYKSPEKWKVSDVDTPSDIYSFGIVVYELLTGAVPFPVKEYKHGTEMLALEEKHKTAEIPDLCKNRLAAIHEKEFVIPEKCDIPDWLINLVKKCLQKSPHERFKTGRELSDFYYAGKNGLINISAKENSEANSSYDAYLEIEENIFTQPQRFYITKELTTIGRCSDVPGDQNADIAIKTADRFISKNHCQLIKRVQEDGKLVFLLQDNAPSKNGTFYNTRKPTQPLPQGVNIVLKDGDYFHIGNTTVIFHKQNEEEIHNNESL